jgi:hypothetical protein
LPTIFAVTTAYAMLFAALSALRWPPAASACAAGFVTLIGISQMLLFGGQRPRAASVIAGTTLLMLGTIGAWVANGARQYPDPALLMGGLCTALSGAVLGYLSGACVGGVFLVADLLRGRFGRRDVDV